MIAVVMVYSVLAGVLVAAGARGFEEGLRSIRVPTRFVWLLALLGTIGLTALAPMRDRPAGPVLLEAPAEVLVATDAPASPSAAGGLSIAEALDAVREGVALPMGRAIPLSGGVLGTILPWIWLALSGAGVVTLIGTAFRYRRLKRALPLVELDGFSVRISRAIGPAVLGVLRPEIVVPRWLLRSPAEERRLVLLHEREHLLARDSLTLGAGCLLAALLPWNPVVWWMLFRLRLAVEVDCDSRVLRRGVRPQLYGSMLIDVSGHGSGLGIGAPAIAGFPSNLERRLRAMTNRKGRMMWVRGAGLAGLGGLALLAACEARLPTAPEIEAMDVADVQARMERLGILAIGDTDVTYYRVNGDYLSAEEVLAIEPGSIREIQLLVEEGRRVISIVTGDAVLAADPPLDHSAPSTPPPTGIAGTGGAGEPLYLIDGRVATADEVARLHLGPGRIQSVSVLKAAAATAAYDDPRAANGVILIETRANVQADPVGSATDTDSPGRLELLGHHERAPVSANPQPLVVIGGRIASREEFDRLDPGSVAHISVLKSETATREYDDPRAANGVILVTLRSDPGAAESPAAPRPSPPRP